MDAGESRINDTKEKIIQNALHLALECTQGHSVTQGLASLGPCLQHHF
jgi:hypothetical protein